jgi:hypothetical protein
MGNFSKRRGHCVPLRGGTFLLCSKAKIMAMLLKSVKCCVVCSVVANQ